jgi:serine/threonine-protein phosphatase PP1 catalytic subunit
MLNNRLIQLPDHGRLIVVTDLHGDFNDYRNYLKLWDRDDEDCHIVFTGDLIHSIEKEDGSIEILEDVMVKTRDFPNFHCLLGNHEWSHITSKDVYKGNMNLTANFENLVAFKKGYMEPSLTNYIKFFKAMPYFMKTANGLFISHAGPSNEIYTIEDFKEMCRDTHSSQELYGFLWNRYGNGFDGYTTQDVDYFLDVVGSRLMVVGHTVVDSGYRIVGNQMILSSSFYTTNKCYLDIDLAERLDSMDDLVRRIRKFQP